MLLHGAGRNSMLADACIVWQGLSCVLVVANGLICHMHVAFLSEVRAYNNSSFKYHSLLVLQKTGHRSLHT